MLQVVVDSKNSVIVRIREQLLNQLLKIFALLAGIACAVSILAEMLNGGYVLATLYVYFYVSILYLVTAKRLSYTQKALASMILFALVLASEYFSYGISTIFYSLLFTLVIFIGLLFGSRQAYSTLLLCFFLLSVDFWLDYRAELISSATTFSFGYVLGSWLSPQIAFLMCVAITLNAISIMLLRLQKLVEDKEGLIDELRNEVSLREEIQGELKLTEAQFNRLFEDSEDAVLFVDLEKVVVVLCNASAEKVLDLDADDTRDLSIHKALKKGGREIAAKLKGQDSGEREEITVETLQGHARILEVSANRLNDSLGLLILRNVTEKKRLESQFIQSQKMEAVGQLAGGIAHDFNNTLQVIVGACELVQSGDSPDNNEKAIDQIMSSSLKAQKLVLQLLAFSRQQQMDKRTMDLNEVVEESLELFERVIGQHILIGFNKSPSKLIVKMDQTQIEQALLNLCLNARDAVGKQGQLSISLSRRDIGIAKPSVAELKPGPYAKIEVADSGCGIPEEIKPRIFEPFFTTKPQDEGSGLGLSSVLGIVEQHGGFIDLESKHGEGSKFIIYLPLTNAEIVEEQQTPETIRLRGSGNILLVDDDDQVRNVTSKLLQSGGYSVIESSSGKQAIEQYSKHREEIDLIVLDILMPEMRGDEVYNRIVELQADVPALFITGYSGDLNMDDLQLGDVVQLIRKPYTKQELLNKVADLVRLH